MLRHHPGGPYRAPPYPGRARRPGDTRCLPIRSPCWWHAAPRECLQDFRTWLHEGQQLAADFPGYLGSGVLAPPPGDDEFQIIFRFARLHHPHRPGNLRVAARPGCSAATVCSPSPRRAPPRRRPRRLSSAMPTARRGGNRAWPYWRSFRCRWRSTCCSAACWANGRCRCAFSQHPAADATDDLLVHPLDTCWPLAQPAQAKKKAQASDRIRWPNLYKSIKSVQNVQFFRSHEINKINTISDLIGHID